MRPKNNLEDENTSENKDTTSDDLLGVISETATTVHEDKDVKTTKLAIDDSAKPVDEDLQSEENKDGMAQELSNVRENLNETKAQIQEFQDAFDDGQNDANKGENTG